MPAVKALLMWWIQQPDTNKRVESLNKRTILTIVKLIPVVSAVLAYILILSSAQAGVLTTAAVLLAFFGFVFLFDHVADFFAFCFAQRNFGCRVIGNVVLDDSAHDKSGSFTGLKIKFPANIHIFVAVIAAPSGSNGSLHDI